MQIQLLNQKFYKQPGLIPLQTKFPQLVLDFIKLHGFAAHARRRSGTSTSYGISLNNIHEHMLKNVEGLTKKSVNHKCIIF